MSTFAESVWFTVEHCYSCAMAFAMPSNFRDRKLKDRTNFFCPAGHSQHYVGKTEEQKLREEVERARQMREAAEGRAAKAERDATAISKAHRKMRTRVMNGVCPCCNRSFENLRRHMHDQHPEFDKHRTLAALRQAFGMTQEAVAQEVGIAAPYVSRYEHGKAVSARAARAIEGWIERHEAKEPA
jgi:DNA-binding transcriptional regulator YiaG